MKFRKKKEPPISLEGISGVASRAMYAGHENFPYILLTIKQQYGPDLEVTMNLREASKMTQQLLNSIQAATPRIPRPTANQMFG